MAETLSISRSSRFCEKRSHPSLIGRSEDERIVEGCDHARLSIALWIEEYNHDRPHCGLNGRTPHESSAFYQAKTLISNQASNLCIWRLHYNPKLAVSL